MKKLTLSVLLALVMILSITALSVFAQEWDENDVIDYLGTVEDWDSQLVDGSNSSSEGNLPSGISFNDFNDVSKSVSESDVADSGSDSYTAKSFVAASGNAAEGQFFPCGDGKLWIKITLNETTDTGSAAQPGGVTFIRSIKVTSIGGTTLSSALSLKECRTKEGGSCKAVYFDGNGQAVMYGYVYMPEVLTADSTFDVSIVDARQPRRIYGDNKDTSLVQTITISNAVATAKTSRCISGITVASKPAFTGYYEQCGGKAEFKVAIENTNSDNEMKFVVPSQITIGSESYTNYTCRYTRIGSFGNTQIPNGGDFCKVGEAIPMMPGDIVQFYITIDSLTNSMSDLKNGKQMLVFHVGGMTQTITGNLAIKRAYGFGFGPDQQNACKAKIVPLDPIANAYEDDDTTISPTGAYKTYEKAVAGLYQKCGRFGKFTVTLKNIGAQAGFIKLPASIAVNGGTPISSYWLSTVAPMGDEIVLNSGEKVTLIGNVYITSVPSQLNSDAPMTAAVNFNDLGLYLTGQFFSDRVNWRCNF